MTERGRAGACAPRSRRSPSTTPLPSSQRVVTRLEAGGQTLERHDRAVRARRRAAAALRAPPRRRGAAGPAADAAPGWPGGRGRPARGARGRLGSQGRAPVTARARGEGHPATIGYHIRSARRRAGCRAIRRRLTGERLDDTGVRRRPSRRRLPADRQEPEPVPILDRPAGSRRPARPDRRPSSTELAEEIRETIIRTVARHRRPPRVARWASSRSRSRCTGCWSRRATGSSGTPATRPTPTSCSPGALERFETLRQLDGVGGFPRRSESEHDVFDGGHAGHRPVDRGRACADRPATLRHATGADRGRGRRRGAPERPLARGAQRHRPPPDPAPDRAQRQRDVASARRSAALSKYLSEIKLSQRLAAEPKAPTTRATAAHPDGRPAACRAVAPGPPVGASARPAGPAVRGPRASPTSACCPATTGRAGAHLPARARARRPGARPRPDPEGEGLQPAEKDRSASTAPPCRRCDPSPTPTPDRPRTAMAGSRSPAERRGASREPTRARRRPHRHGDRRSHGRTRPRSRRPGSSRVDAQNTRKRPNYTPPSPRSWSAPRRTTGASSRITAGMPTGTGLAASQARSRTASSTSASPSSTRSPWRPAWRWPAMRPVVALYSTFSQRAFDQLVHDVCQNDLPVLLAIDRAGLVGRGRDQPPGHVHPARPARSLPNLVIGSPEGRAGAARHGRTALGQDGPDRPPLPARRRRGLAGSRARGPADRPRRGPARGPRPAARRLRADRRSARWRRPSALAAARLVGRRHQRPLGEAARRAADPRPGRRQAAGGHVRSTRRPNSLQTSVSTRPPRSRRSRSCWNAARPSAICLAPSCERRPAGRRACRTSRAPVQRSGADREVRVEQCREAGEAAAEVGLRVLRLRVDVHLAVLADEPAELATQLRRPGFDRLARLREERVGVVDEPAERADRVLQQLARHVPDVVRAEPVVGRARECRHRHAGRRERRQERAVEREALHRVVLVADHVEQPAEPAGACLRVERADLPEVAGGEVRLVGVGVADRREHRQAPAGVQVRAALRGTDASAAASRTEDWPVARA